MAAGMIVKSSWDGWRSMVGYGGCFNAEVMQEYAKHQAQAEVAKWLVGSCVLMPEASRGGKHS